MEYFGNIEDILKINKTENAFSLQTRAKASYAKKTFLTAEMVLNFELC